VEQAERDTQKGTGRTEQDRQNKTGRAEQAEQNRQNRTGRTGQAEQDKQNRTSRIGQAEQDRQNRIDSTRHYRRESLISCYESCACLFARPITFTNITDYIPLDAQESRKYFREKRFSLSLQLSPKKIERRGSLSTLSPRLIS
jgi:hypothetical protein